jgi:C-terminal processing protease CtpA/Prc
VPRQLNRSIASREAGTFLKLEREWNGREFASRNHESKTDGVSLRMRYSYSVVNLVLTFALSGFSVLPQSNQKSAPIALTVDQKAKDFQINQSEENSFAVELKGEQRYLIVVEQKGIDLVLRLADPGGRLIKEQDGTNGANGPEKIFVQPESKGRYSLLIKPLKKPAAPFEGWYSIRVSRVSGKMATYRLDAQQQDFDLLVGSLKEAHTGLNWYSTYKEFENLCANQRKMLSDKMTVLEFYRVIAPIVAFTKEGHTAIRLSVGDTSYLQAFGSYFPFQIKFLNKQAYVINDFDGIKAKGFLLTRINGKGIDEIVKTFLSVEPDDGYIVTGKYRWIEENGAFPWFYLRCFGSSASFAVELADPKTNRQIVLDKVRGVKYAEYRRLWKESTPPNVIESAPVTIEFQPEIKTAILRYNDFDTQFKGEKFDFKGFVAQAFEGIRNRGIEHLIIDIRKTSGGEEGLEDYIFAFLTNKPYTKYRYVQASGPTYSFLKYTNYSTKEKQERLEAAIKQEHYLASDGRLLRRKGILTPAEPRPDAYTGKLYVLTSGLTYSGGSEFASIIKGNRRATFIGEETGGGYYGNTSGSYIRLTLPNSQIWIRIPLLKFVVEVGGDIPFGRGVIPDHEIQPTIDEYLNGVDAEMNYALKLIRDSR